MLQKPQFLVHSLPIARNVAVLFDQHSIKLGHLASSHTVWSLCSFKREPVSLMILPFGIGLWSQEGNLPRLTALSESSLSGFSGRMLRRVFLIAGAGLNWSSFSMLSLSLQFLCSIVKRCSIGNHSSFEPRFCHRGVGMDGLYQSF